MHYCSPINSSLDINQLGCFCFKDFVSTKHASNNKIWTMRMLILVRVK